MPACWHQLSFASLDADDYLEVEDLPTADVAARIEALVVEAVASIMAGRGLSYRIPSRSATAYVPELDRILLKNKPSERSFLSVAQVRKTAITTRVMQLVHQILQKGIHVTKRDLFYNDAKLFQDQGESDTVLEVRCGWCAVCGIVVLGG